MSTVPFIRPKEHSGRVIEKYTHTGVTELIAQSILVTVINPLADPKHRHGRWVLSFIYIQKNT